MQYAYIFAMAYAPQSFPLVCFGHFICLTEILGKVGGGGVQMIFATALSVAVEIYISPLLRSGYFQLHS